MGVKMASNQVPSIKVSADEVKSGRLTERHLEQAVRALVFEGLVVVENAVEHSVLDKLNEKMVKDATYLRSLGEKGPFNYNQGNLQQDAPPVREHFDPSIFLSKSSGFYAALLTEQDPLASHITSTVLGPRPKMTFCSGNTAMPATGDIKPQRQPVHSDADFKHPPHPFALVVNVPLVTMKPKNGSTEVWLGTHTNTNIEDQEGAHGERASGRIKQSLLEERRRVSPPIQGVIPKGSVIVRDLRLWHAGMPNYSDEIRVMLAFSKLTVSSERSS
jgi:ectoine hydroxylase-related dioxygenase (phytanoyl-CoA dioxygenase family)